MKVEIETRFGTTGLFVSVKNNDMIEPIGWLAPPDSLPREHHAKFGEMLKGKFDGVEFVYE